MPRNKVQLTKNGHGEIQKELDDLKNNRLPAAIDRVAKAREFGDLSENSEYDSARQDLAWIHGRIAELEDILNRSEIVRTTTSKTKVGLGSVVLVGINDSQHEFTLVGEWEANPAAKKISHQSPLGKALMGKKPGDKIEVEAPAGKITYHIKAIK